MSQSDSQTTPPMARRNQTPDATAPDGSEIRLLIGGRHMATRVFRIGVLMTLVAIGVLFAVAVPYWGLVGEPLVP